MTKYYTKTSMWDGNAHLHHYDRCTYTALLFFDSEGNVTREEAFAGARVIFPPETAVQYRSVALGPGGDKREGWLIGTGTLPSPLHGGISYAALYGKQGAWARYAALELHYVADIHAEPFTESVVDLQTAYGECVELPRVMGTCPCPMSDTHVCAERNVFSRVDVPLGRLLEQFQARPQSLPTEDLPASAGDFQYISGRYLAGPEASAFAPAATWLSDLCTDADSIREAREHLAKMREAADDSKRFYKSDCLQCAFQPAACASSSRSFCDSAKTEEEVREYLERQMRSTVSELQNLRGFTREQRDFLMGATGEAEYRTAKVNPFSSRATYAYLGGFSVGSPYTPTRFAVRHARCDRRNTHYVGSWEEMCRLLPDLEARYAEFGELPISDEVLFLYAALEKECTAISVGWGGRWDRLLLEVHRSNRVEARYGNRSGPMHWSSVTLSVRDSPSTIYDTLYGKQRGYRI